MSVKQGGKMLIIDEQCMNEQRPRCEYVNVCVCAVRSNNWDNQGKE